MAPEIILASGSESRAQMLRAACVSVTVRPARVDEDMMRRAMQAESAPPRDIADALAEMKARKVAEREPKAIVIGSDQVLALGKEILSKPDNIDAARDQLRALRGQRHMLLSAVVIYEDSRPVWRHVGVVRLRMRNFGDDYLEAYLARNTPGILDSVGAYKLEQEGVRLFDLVEGDYFTVLGLPLVPLLTYLGDRGFIDG